MSFERLGCRLRGLEGPLILGCACLILAMAALVPLVELAVELARAGVFGLAVLASPRPWMLLARSVVLAGATTALALAVGVPLGVVFARARIPARRALFALHTVPMALPPFLLVLGWFHLFGRTGLLGNQGTAAHLFSSHGLVLVEGLAFAPVATTLTALGVSAIDPSLEEAARLVAHPLRVAVRILLPAAAKAVVVAALVVFALAFGELGVPMFLRQDVYPAAVFARLGGVDYAPGEAAALALPLFPIAFALLAIEGRVLGKRAFTVLGLRSGEGQRMEFGRPLTVACLVAAALSALPIVALALRAAQGKGFERASQWLGTAPSNSLYAAFAAATVVAAIGLVLGHALARGSVVARIADRLALLTFFLPAAVLGVGIIAAWNRPETLFVYGSAAILVIGFVARYAVVGSRVFAAVVAQSPVSFEEAAVVSGAGPFRRLLRVVVPMHRQAAVAAWLTAAVFCLRDLETAVLFYPPGGEPLTVRIFTLEANGPGAVVAALAVAHVALTVTTLFVGAALLRRGGRR